MKNEPENFCQLNSLPLQALVRSGDGLNYEVLAEKRNINEIKFHHHFGLLCANPKLESLLNTSNYCL